MFRGLEFQDLVSDRVETEPWKQPRCTVQYWWLSIFRVETKYSVLFSAVQYCNSGRTSPFARTENKPFLL